MPARIMYTYSVHMCQGLPTPGGARLLDAVDDNCHFYNGSSQFPLAKSLQPTFWDRILP